MMIETINLKEMLPEWYQGVYEMNKLMEVEQSLLDELALKIKQSQDNGSLSNWTDEFYKRDGQR